MVLKTANLEQHLGKQILMRIVLIQLRMKLTLESIAKMAGSLVNAMICTRPDLSYIVTKLAQHLPKPNAGGLAYAEAYLSLCQAYCGPLFNFL